MFDEPLMLWVNRNIVDTIHLSKGNKFATGTKIKAAGESKLNDCPGHIVYYNSTVFNYKLKL